MALGHEKHIDTLNNLAKTNQDAEQGYRTAADGTSDPSVKAIFEQYAQRHAQMAQEVRECVRNLGGDPSFKASASGALYRGWVNIKSALSRNDALAMLEECERGEDYNKVQYKQALESGDLPMDVRPVLEQQYQQVLEAHDRIKMLRDARKH